MRDQPGRKARGRIKHRAVGTDDVEHLGPHIGVGMGIAPGFAVVGCHDEAARPPIEAGPDPKGLEALQIGKIALKIFSDLVIVL